MSTWSRASRRRLPTNRSPTGFMFGARTAVLITRVPAPLATRSNVAPNFSSRSRIRNLGGQAFRGRVPQLLPRPLLGRVPHGRDVHDLARALIHQEEEEQRP